MKNNDQQRKRHLLFYIIMFSTVIVCIELLSQLTFLIIFHTRYTADNLEKFVVSRYDKTDQRANFLKQEIIHPYVGYVIDFGDEEKNNRTQGFVTDFPPVVKKEKDILNVVVMGGSVANQLANSIWQSMDKTFKTKLRLINLALPGYKQPQQLMTLAYFLSLGAEYDLVINIDGFNEVVLPYVENYPAHISLFFPRSWRLRITDNPSHQELALIGKLTYSQDLKKQRLAELSGSIFNRSAAYGLVKMLQLMKNNRDIYNGSTGLLSLQKKSPKRFIESGPLEHYKNITQIHEAAAEAWAHSSLLMNGLAQSKGFEYYHVLQPNQYLEGSKRLTREEKRIAYKENHLYRQSVVIGYPMLIQKGQELLKNKVNFIDATMFFANVDDTVYSDTCCHFNKKGIGMLTDYILQEISRRSQLETLKPAGPLPH